MNETWTRAEAIELCGRLEAIAPAYNAHIALTGGCLYKHGERKDVDIMIYRIRQDDSIRAVDLFVELKDRLGINLIACYGWVAKATIETLTGTKDIDFFFPEDRKHDLHVEMTDEQRVKYGWGSGPT